MARYFPQFWRQTRPFAKHLAERLRQAARSGGLPAANQVLFEDIAASAQRAGRPLRSLLDNNLYGHEGLLGQSLAHWEAEGGEVLDFAPALVEALRHSDCGEMQLADVLGTTERALYLHFGPQTDIVMGAGQPVEGLLVLHTPSAGYSRMMLMGRTDTGWLEGVGQSQMLRFRLADMARLPFDLAIDAAVALDVQDIEDARKKLHAQDPAGLLATSNSFDEAQESQRRNARAYTQALQLAGNALAYVTAYPDDIQTQWQPGTSEALSAKAAKPGKEGFRAASKLRSMGYREVRVVGGEFERADERARAGGPRSAHWRRGHWRNQAHGPQLSLRKLIWIQPMRVLGNNESATLQAPPPVQGVAYRDQLH